MLKTLADKVRPHLLPAVLLLVITAAIYCRVLGHDFLLNWDDNEYVLDNDAVYGISISHIQRVFGSYYVGNYAPVQMLSYMLDYELWGLWPGGFLLTNILLHFLNGLILYGLLFTIYRDRLLAATAAAIFLFHPLQVESVAWISQRKNLLAMLFFLLAWRGYIAFRGKDGRHAWYYYAGALVAFLLALLSKSVAVIFPLVILLYDHCFYPPGRRQRLADKLPFIALATLTAALALRTQSVECGCGRVPFGHYGGSVLATMLTMAPVWCRYLGMLFWPANLSAMYDPAIHKTIDMPVALALLLLAGAGYICLMLLKADRRTGFWPLLFLIGFLPVSQIVPLVTLMNDRYAYFPLLGAAVMGGIGAVKLRERLGSSRKFLGLALIAVPLLLLATVSWQRCAVWRNAATLWRDAARKSPSKADVWEKLGEASSGDSDGKAEALHALRTAVKLDPARDNARFKLGLLAMELGEYDEALVHLGLLAEKNPKNVVVMTALGRLYLKRGDYGAAGNALERAYTLQPEAAEVLKSLGDLSLTLRKMEAAREYYLKLERRGGDDPQTAYDLACVEAMAGRKREALEWLRVALRRGYDDSASLLYGKELAGVRSDERFGRLLRQYLPTQEEQRPARH